MEEKNVKKIKFSTVLTIILILVVIGLTVFSVYLFNQFSTYKNAYLKGMDIVVSMATSGRYPDCFYATIEDISTNQSLNGQSVIKVKGLDINDKRYREEFTFGIILDNIGDNFKIEHNGADAPFSSLKVGQTIAVYDYSHTSDKAYTENTEEGYLSSIHKVSILDDNL